jgi:hypothetical protein
MSARGMSRLISSVKLLLGLCAGNAAGRFRHVLSLKLRPPISRPAYSFRNLRGEVTRAMISRFSGTLS